MNATQPAQRATSYDPASDHYGPLFDLEAPVESAGEGSRTPTERTCGSALCPECTTTRRIGLVRQGIHVVWKVHTRRTWGGATLQCPASGAALCETGNRADETVELESLPVCRHS